MFNADRVICVCSGTTAKDVRAAMQRGAHTLEELAGRLNGTGTSCELCRELLEEVLAEHTQDRAPTPGN